MNKYMDYTTALAASMNETQRVLTEALARNFWAMSRRNKEANNKIHGVNHAIHKQTKTL